MRKGTVVYLTDAGKVCDDFDEVAAIEALGLDPRWAVMAASSEGYLGMPEAIWTLAVRGAKAIDAIWAAPGAGRRVEIFGQAVRVFG